MTEETTQTRIRRRILGVHDSGVPGPTLVALGGIHGNEAGGIHAVDRVLDLLREKSIPLRGRLVGMAGNLAALDVGQRYVERDLNRVWSPADINALRDRPVEADGVEDREQRELVEALVACEGEATGPMLFLDLHTSSAPGSSFSCMSDTLANRGVALALPIPMILGLEECIDGAIMEFFNRGGRVAVAIEGGQHDDAVSIDNLAAAVWLVLDAAKMLPAGQVDLDACRETLVRSAHGQPRALEILYRQHIEAGDEFVMQPGFQSLQRVSKGQVLATCNGVELCAPADCRVLLPLYQGQGEDGYFLVSPVSAFWLKVAAVLRRMRLQAIVHWLPGVRRHPTLADTLTVEPRFARDFVVGFLHLLGYRRQRMVGGRRCFSRRRDSALD